MAEYRVYDNTCKRQIGRLSCDQGNVAALQKAKRLYPQFPHPAVERIMTAAERQQLYYEEAVLMTRAYRQAYPEVTRTYNEAIRKASR